MRRYAPRLVVVAGFVLAALAFSWPLPLRLATHLTGDPGGDTGVYVWNQWVFHHEVVEGRNPLTTDKILSLTATADLTQHNYTAFLNVLALPLISLLGVIASFNVVFLLVCVLNATMTYGLVRRVTAASRLEAWLAGLLFAWAPAMVARSTGHFSLVAAAALPAFLWALVNAERSRSTRDAALVGLCMAWAALSDAYFGIYCLLLAMLYVAAALLRVTRNPRPVAKSWLWVVDVLIVCFGGLIAGLALGRGGEFSLLGFPVRVRSLYNPVLILTALIILRTTMWWRPQFRVFDVGPVPLKAIAVAAFACLGPMAPVLYGIGNRVAEGRFVSPDIFWRSSPRGVDVLAFLTPNPHHPLMRWWLGDPLTTRATHFVEYTASISLVALAAIVIAAWRAGYRPSRRWVLITIAFALLALGPFIYVGGINTHVPGPWALLRYVPGLGLARMPTRFGIVALLGLCVLFAGALAALSTRWPQRRRQITALITVLLVLELWPAPRPLYSAAVSPIYERIAADPRPVRVLVLPFGVRDGVWEAGNFRPRTQFTQIVHGKALIGGYLSRISRRRVQRMRDDYPALDALIKLSEPAPLAPDIKTTLDQLGRQLIEQGSVGYVVIDERFIEPERAQLVIDAMSLIEVQRDAYHVLYVPE
ncbi:MAG TPA: hypothetical protein VEC39_06330 [Vicinamibacterales bacterium]|nr:hypothetical protein [Vicinamibacterales bacterium]